MEFFASPKFWIAFQLLVDLLLILFILRLIRNVKSGFGKRMEKRTAERITRLIEPLLAEAEQTAVDFEAQLAEKKRLIREMGDTLDSRLDKIGRMIRKLSESSDSPQQGDVYGQMDAIFSLIAAGLDEAAVARKLGMTEGEVRLVIEMKRKFREMEQSE